jgi:hypothetical protein
MFKGFVLGKRRSEPYIASFKDFYCRNPGSRMPKIDSVERKGSTKGFIVVGRTYRAMPPNLHSCYAN